MPKPGQRGRQPPHRKPAGSAGSAAQTGMLRERCHRCSPPRAYPHPPGDSRPGPLSLSAEPSNAPRLPPSIPSKQPPIPTSPGEAPSCGRAGGAAAVPSAATAPGAGAAAGEEARARYLVLGRRRRRPQRFCSSDVKMAARRVAGPPRSGAPRPPARLSIGWARSAAR